MQSKIINGRKYELKGKYKIWRNALTRAIDESGAVVTLLSASPKLVVHRLPLMKVLLILVFTDMYAFTQSTMI